MRRPIRENDYVRENDGEDRWGRVVEVVYESYGHIGVEVSHYMVQLESGEIVRFEWLPTRRLTTLEAMAYAAKKPK